MGKPTLEEIQQVLNELLAEGVVEIRGTRNGAPVYVLSDAERMEDAGSARVTSRRKRAAKLQ